MSPLETDVCRLVAALSDDALAALASRGLLRRAERDRERGVLLVPAGEHAGALRFLVDAFQVDVPPAGPARAACSCPAPGICQHILAAVLFLRERSRSLVAAPEAGPAPADARIEGSAPPASGPAPGGGAGAQAAEVELLTFGRESLLKWAGRDGFNAGVRIAAEAEAVVVRGSALLVQFPALNAQCHFAPGAGLDGAIVGGGIGGAARWVVAAVLVVRRAAGLAWPEVDLDPGGALEPGDTPRSRGEVLAACLSLHHDLLRFGLAHVSAAAQERLATLAVSALGVNLPRLAQALRELADECRLELARDAAASPARWLEHLACAHALATALNRPGTSQRDDLVGVHRTRYVEVGSLDLAAVAAWPWRTGSGYEGLTVLFWDRVGRRWTAWSDSRPRHQLAGFNPVARYTQPGPWEGVESPRAMARHRLRLQYARRNVLGRLSSSTRTRALITGKTDVASLNWPVWNDWSKLAGGVAARTSRAGLREANPLDAVVVIRPAGSGERQFDPQAQTLRWVLFDGAGRGLVLALEFSDLTGLAIERLETLEPARLIASWIVGKLHRDRAGLMLEPYSVHTADGRACHLALDRRKPNPTLLAAAPEAGSSDDEPDIDPPEAAPEAEPAVAGVLGSALGEAEDILLALAESGVGTPSVRALAAAAAWAQRGRELQLSALAAAFERVAAAGADPEPLLRCAYLLHLHRHAAPSIGDGENVPGVPAS